jgi:hypothetical protein
LLFIFRVLIFWAPWAYQSAFSQPKSLLLGDDRVIVAVLLSIIFVLPPELSCYSTAEGTPGIPTAHDDAVGDTG